MAKAPKQIDPSEAEGSAPVPQSDPTTLWSPEDLSRLDEAINSIASLVTDLRTQVESLDARVRTMEPMLSKLNLGEDLLPFEIAKGVEPAQIYVASLQAAILGICMANPIGLLNQRGAESNISRAFDIANRALTETVRRSQLAAKKVG
jgi:hypothetical protein